MLFAANLNTITPRFSH